MKNISDKNLIINTVDCLISGMSLNRVSEDLYPFLIDELNEAKAEAIFDGEKEIVLKIQKILKEIQNKIKNNKTIKKKIPNQKFNDPIYQMRQIQKESTEMCDYKYSKIIEQQIQQKKEEEILTINYLKLNSDQNDYQLQLSNVKNELRNNKKYWKIQEKNFNKLKNNSINSLKNLHNQQIIDLENSYPEYPPNSFLRNSLKVIDLRIQEKKLAQIKLFDDALSCQKLANKIEFEELKEKFENFDNYFQIQKIKLIQNQKKELNCLIQNWDRKNQILIQEKNKDINSLNNYIKHLEFKLGIRSINKPSITVSSLTIDQNRKDILKASKIAFSRMEKVGF